MKYSITALLLFAVISVANAASDELTGQFTHDFTNPASEPVWTVSKAGAEWRVRLHGANEQISAKEASKTEKHDLWEQLWWPAEKAADARCLRFGREWPAFLCHVPPSVRVKIGDLAKNKSDYFYFDSMMGLQEIRLKAK